MEPVSPSVWRSAKRNTARSVRAVAIARSEQEGCPPRVVRGAATQASIASGVNHTVRLPRARRAASYSAQLITRCCCFGMWRRQAALALNGTAGSEYPGRGRRPTPPSSRRQPADPCNKVDLCTNTGWYELPNGIAVKFKYILGGDGYNIFRIRADGSDKVFLTDDDSGVNGFDVPFAHSLAFFEQFPLQWGDCPRT